MKWLMTALLLLGAAAGEAADFYAHWGDGKAELSSYKIVQPRYGELREGYGVMIFVTEDINRRTLIKVESSTPDKDRLYVLKLNNVLKFTTGLYDYSVMTSVFSQVEGGENDFALRKISLSAQEWCGHVFDEALLRDDKIKGHINSYFESEGRRDYELKLPAAFESEDNLLIRIRELKGPFMVAGEEREVEVLPSLWSVRMAHRSHEIMEGRVRKGAVEVIAVAGDSLAAVEWEWTIGERQRKIWTEKAYPHRILRWRDGDGARGELMRTIRVPYWELHGNGDEGYRRELGIP